ncbi:3-hydroxyacyl-CoA dehydrogenase NAD-binding domain-containing protein [Sphaerisporangium sp. TRM90804]|uniref:3-hydroxyacyl-CoA dehydrogenase NAD-binding domain-containing protein n=1 Tax=Sphaerisporangium sp. TRM90804 TaxID=3031113 RepID=UPI0024478936|nr:3-hydroxyacyl-CoA dehydrogenase NAD-binding domain-containing protein [Sphaerisporangium sp. TRM90804]MDH2426656.1 3-hydroxyacyl-CoA dehydrogenase NAD-binding domain-containing protein [Sphaerisporangium sp. TRM90804]
MSGITEIFDDEVVTRALVRDVRLPGGAGTMALITLDNGFDHTKPSTFGPRGLAELDKALDSVAARTDLAAVGVTGKPFIFAVGADLKGAGLVRRREQAEELGRLGHEVFRRLGEMEVPSFAFVNGAVMGGGLELALHCTYRTISSGVPAVALPECFLGLVPGWGGTQLLPRLIGPANALKLIIENPLAQNRMTRGKEAFELGVADAVFEPADFLEESLRWAARVLTGETSVARPPFTQDASSWDAAVAAAKSLVDGKLRGASPAPYRALELVELARTAGRDEGFEAETRVLADLLMGDELRAGLYSFDLVQRRAKRPAGAPDRALARKVTKVGVVGAGLMASQLALLFARRLEVPVVLTDLDQARVDKGVGYVHAEVGKLLSRGRIGPDQANRLKALVSGSTDKAAFAGADFVIEAVFEDLAVKKQVFAEVEAVVGPECVLATNTSSLPVTAMAAGLRHPERVVGFHFFNPVAVLPLLEIVRGERTDDATLATAFAVGKTLNKSSVLVKDAPAFVVNRLLIRMMGEVLGAVDEGTPIETAEHALDDLGLPMSPFALLQLVGPAVALHVSETLHEAFPDRYRVSQNLATLVKAGKPGVYAPDFTVDPEARQIFEGAGAAGTALSGRQVRDRALRALAEEARFMLDEGVVAAPEDIDLCMLLGAGWPFHTGGLTPLLDRTGISAEVTGRPFLSPGVASVPA